MLKPHATFIITLSSVNQISRSVMSDFCDPMDCCTPRSLSFTISHSLVKLMFIELVMPSNHLILYRPLLLPLIFPSIRVFSSASALHIRWPKYCSFSFSKAVARIQSLAVGSMPQGPLHGVVPL